MKNNIICDNFSFQKLPVLEEQRPATAGLKCFERNVVGYPTDFMTKFNE